MVDYIDQRPTPAQAVDTLRAQLIKARTPASTPHGIKIARQNEATLYLDSTGARAAGTGTRSRISMSVCPRRARS